MQCCILAIRDKRPWQGIRVQGAGSAAACFSLRSGYRFYWPEHYDFIGKCAAGEGFCQSRGQAIALKGRVILKIDWNRKYTTIAVYAFLVIAAGLFLSAFLNNFGYFKTQLTGTARLLQPFLVGFVLAYLLNPLLKWSERTLKPRVKKPRLLRGLGLLLTYLLTVVFLVLFFWIIIPQVITSITHLSRNLSRYLDSIDLWVKQMIETLPLNSLPEQITESLNDVITQLYRMMASILPWVLSVAGGLTSSIFSFIMGIIISLYMLSNKERFFAQIKKTLYAFFPVAAVDSIIDITRDGNKKFSGFISGKLLDSLIIGIICFVGMSIFKMPYALLVSMIVGITNVVPYFGPFIGAVPSFLIILTADPVKALWFILFVFVLQQFDGNILGPRILGETTGLSAFWVIFAILFFGNRMGFMGMLIGVPLFAVIYTVFGGIVHHRLAKKGMPTATAEYASDKHELID